MGVVGPSGTDAAALAAFSQEKHDANAPVGALLARTDKGGILYPKQKTTTVETAPTRYLDFWINDCANRLGDNADSLLVCVSDARLLK